MSIAAAVMWICVAFLIGVEASIGDRTEDRTPTKVVCIIAALVGAFAFGVYGACKWGTIQ